MATPLDLEPVPGCLACGGTSSAPFVTTRAMMHPGDESFTFVRCGDCGLVYLSPRVPAAALGRYYTPHYLPYRGPEAWGRWRGLVASGLARTDRRRIARVRRHVAVEAGTRVLDVGCGRPTFLRALVDATGCDATGTDFSDEGWRGGEGVFGDLTLLEGDLHALSLTGPYDALTMWHYLEHDYAPAATLRRVAELAAPGARLFVEVPDHGSWSRRRWGPWWAGYHTPRHTALWDAHTIRVLLEGAGWAVELVEPRGTLDPYTLEWMSRMERAGIDWSSPMAPRFLGYVAGRAAAWPLLAAWKGATGQGGRGLLTAVARLPGP